MPRSNSCLAVLFTLLSGAIRQVCPHFMHFPHFQRPGIVNRPPKADSGSLQQLRWFGRVAITTRDFGATFRGSETQSVIDGMSGDAGTTPALRLVKLCNEVEVRSMGENGRTEMRFVNPPGMLWRGPSEDWPYKAKCFTKSIPSTNSGEVVLRNLHPPRTSRTSYASLASFHHS